MPANPTIKDLRDELDKYQKALAKLQRKAADAQDDAIDLRTVTSSKSDATPLTPSETKDYILIQKATNTIEGSLAKNPGADPPNALWVC